MRQAITPKQQRFAEEYLVDLNATAAARRAGYKDPNKGRQLVAKSNVSELIQQLRDKVSRDTGITVEKIIGDLKKRGTMAEDAGQFGPSIKALELLGKTLGMFIDRQEARSEGVIKIIVERHD